MKGKKPGKRHQKASTGEQFIVLKDLHKHKHKETENEVSTMVRVFYSTGNHRHPVQYWKMIRNKNIN
jgi:hypothetical protein